MLSERIQRVMMATLLVVILYLFNIQETAIASILLTGAIVLVTVWAVFDFCPSLWALRKILKEECKNASLSRDN